MAFNTYTPGEYNPPIAHYSQITVPDFIQVGLLVGKNGRHFKNITYESGCKYIWYDKERNVIEIWGSIASIKSAEDLLKTRFDNFKPNKTNEELREMVKVVNECTRQNGDKVVEMEGPEWAVRDYCNASYSEFMVDEAYNIDEVFWMKIVLL
jgi:hypothetical protein